jgi:hypothetical protein
MSKIKRLPLIFEPGVKFGTLTVISMAGKDKTNNRLVECRCDCGSIVTPRASRLEKLKSCGCKNNIKHGETRSKEHRIWCHMRDRCYNPNNPDYKTWGGKGVKVCDRWRESFSNFLKDMGRAPSPKHTIDRYPDNKGDYKPGNCRWATLKEQQGNRTNNRWIEYNGERMIMQDWVRRLKIHQGTLGYYLNRGKTIGDIIKLRKHVNAS